MDYKAEFERIRALFEDEFTRLVSGAAVIEPLGESMRYSLFGGGKRFRPVLLLKTYEMLAGGIDAAALYFAAAVETLHTYSLIHDDLPCMDDDDFRRGKPTSHKKFGEDIAVLTGDALLNAAFEWVFAAVERSKDKAAAVRAGAKFASLTGARGLIAGQIADLGFANGSKDFAALENVYAHKTCDLIVAAVTCGAILAGGDDDTVKALSEYAYNFGFAFQLADDLLDKDSGEGCSVLAVTDEARARELLELYTSRAVEALKGVKADTGFMEYFALTSQKRMK